MKAMMWAVVGADQKIDPYCVMRTRKDCINAATCHCPWRWPELRKEGYTVRRVTVTFDPDETRNLKHNAPSASGVDGKPASA